MYIYIYIYVEVKDLPLCTSIHLTSLSSPCVCLLRPFCLLIFRDNFLDEKPVSSLREEKRYHVIASRSS